MHTRKSILFRDVRATESLGETLRDIRPAVSLTYEQKQQKFKRWLDLFFIKRGRYKLTEKAIEEFSRVEERPKQFIESNEDYSSKDRDEMIVKQYGPTKKEKRRIALEKVKEMIKEGKAEELFDKGYIDSLRVCWGDKANRVAAIRKIVEVLGKKPKEVDSNDFRDCGLFAVLKRNNGMAMSPKVYHDKKFRVGGTRWLVWKTGKEAKDIIVDDFKNNGLIGLLSNYYKDSSYLAFVEAGYAYSKEEILEQAQEMKFETDKIYPWEMANAPHIYENKEIRIAASKWLKWKTGKEPRDISATDFENNGLRGVLSCYKGSPCLALEDAGYIYSIKEALEHAKVLQFRTDKIYPWEMENSPRIYDDKEIRIAAVKWTVWKLGKEAKNITATDFQNNGLSRLLKHYYNDSPFEALLEAGLVTKEDEAYMRRDGAARFLPL
jgi:hypothetical protein